MSVKMPPGTAEAKKVETKTKTKTADAATTKWKPQKSSKHISKASGLSEEKIVDSDSEGDAPITKPEHKKKDKTKSAKQNAAAKPPSPSPKASSPSSSEEDEEESSEEDEQPVPKKSSVIPAQVNGVKRKASESSSEESSEDEDESEQPAKKAKTGQDVEMKDTSSSGGEDEDEGENEEDEEEAQDKDRAQSKRPADTAKETQPQVAIPKPLSSIPAAPFEPPEGYVPIKTVSPHSSSMFSQHNLAGKQVWLISAPSNLPISSIEEVAMQAIQQGSTVLQHNGIDYALSEDKDRNVQFLSLMLPSQEGFRRVDARVERALRLQQKIQLPNLSKLQADSLTGSNASGDVSRAAVSTIRPQPRGLKMRYKPPAFGLGNPGLGSDSDEEGRTSSGAFQFPKELGVHGLGDKEDSGRSKKKEKKKRKSGDVDMINGRDMLPPSTTTPAKKSKKKDKVGETPERPLTAVSVDSVGSEQRESKEERKRKKKLKKEGREST